jgi:hypothetical protein
MSDLSFSWAEFLRLGFLSVACGTISFTISKSKFFAGIRKLVEARVPFLGEGISCPYCVSHWIALLLTMVYLPHPVVSGWVYGLFIDYFVAAMAMVALAAITARVIFSSYIVMMIPTNETKNG